MTPQQSFEKRHITISYYMAGSIILFFIAIGWKGSEYYHDLKDYQQASTYVILSKIDSLEHKQDLKDQDVYNRIQINADQIRKLNQVVFKTWR